MYTLSFMGKRIKLLTGSRVEKGNRLENQNEKQNTEFSINVLIDDDFSLSTNKFSY